MSWLRLQIGEEKMIVDDLGLLLLNKMATYLFQSKRQRNPLGGTRDVCRYNHSDYCSGHFTTLYSNCIYFVLEVK